jgi:hypothetical protein
MFTLTLTAVLICDICYECVRDYTNVHVHTFPSNPDLLSITSNKKRGKTIIHYNDYVIGVAPRMLHVTC